MFRKTKKSAAKKAEEPAVVQAVVVAVPTVVEAPAPKMTAAMPHFLCPITHDIMFDPVIAEDERTYERAAITEWLTLNENSPLDPSRKLDVSRLVTNRAVREAIEELISRPDEVDPDVRDSWFDRQRLSQMPKAQALFDDGNVLGAAKLGHSKAEGIMARRYASGLDGLEKDPTKSFVWAALAAKHGDADGQFRTGFAYQKGLGTTRDYALAVESYQEAVSQGEVSSMLNLGQIYHAGGFGVKQDFETAYSWYRKGAEKGDNAACESLADCLRVGMGCDQDEKEARVWYLKASELGHEKARFKLALMHLTALGGERDIHGGLQLIERAIAEDKDQDATKFLSDLGDFLDATSKLNNFSDN
mmetsp:Transcript_47891/g.89254  ORF Transcript_47891/g.89254 Transcript_47891/m.89254 type:complete len:360 (+) Transcript_47891:217-1296(+)